MNNPPVDTNNELREKLADIFKTYYKQPRYFPDEEVNKILELFAKQQADLLKSIWTEIHDETKEIPNHLLESNRIVNIIARKLNELKVKGKKGEVL